MDMKLKQHNKTGSLVKKTSTKTPPIDQYFDL